MAQKITHWLVVALILSLGFGQLLRFDFYGVPIYLHDILVICILTLQGLTLKGEPNPQTQRREGQTLKVGILVFLFALIISSLHALFLYPLSSLLAPSLYMFRLIAYLTLFVVLKQSKLQIPKVVFLYAGAIILVIGLAQYFFMPDMRIFQYLGWDDHLSRLTLPHFDPTFTGVMLALAFLSTVHTGNWRLSSFIYLPAILLTYARSVWLSLFLTVMFFTKSAKYLLLVSSVLLLVIVAIPRRFGEGTNLLRTYSISSRIESDLSYIQKYKWDLVLGRGLNTLVLEQNTSHATGPNNSYLYLLLTSGVLGLVGWGIFMKSLYLRSVRKPMLVFFFIASIFNNVMFYPFALLWVLLIESMVPTSA